MSPFIPHPKGRRFLARHLRELTIFPEKLFGDGGYDAIILFDFCYKNQIQTIIPIRKNAKPKILAQPLRHRESTLQQIDFDLWKYFSEYGLRTAVGRIFRHLNESLEMPVHL
ncbi:MAG: hypothetical protein H6500_06975 [Candidatus Woesearchaeota archaeon]|nr:MAG: hypothetical protein H6500_06975 [Candidatus Woesearchaeota archaeon]